MIDPKNVSFPLTVEAFTALQQAELGREIDPREKEFFAGIVEVSNEAYEAAAQGDAETVQGILDAINTAPVHSQYTRHIAAMYRGWVLLGCSRGMELLNAIIGDDGKGVLQ